MQEHDVGIAEFAVVAGWAGGHLVGDVARAAIGENGAGRAAKHFEKRERRVGVDVVCGHMGRQQVEGDFHRAEKLRGRQLRLLRRPLGGKFSRAQAVDREDAENGE